MPRRRLYDVGNKVTAYEDGGNIVLVVRGPFGPVFTELDPREAQNLVASLIDLIGRAEECRLAMKMI